MITTIASRRDCARRGPDEVEARVGAEPQIHQGNLVAVAPANVKKGSLVYPRKA